ncbi:phosphatidylinositol glycan, class X, isoform CRA_d [Rattus norvegicus]|uniref:Phosphatidylinositol-glycan biosynthesis class X protein n=1 Tax=Rattus norvegicus TaxID=10116 RepID=A6IRT7_RAT|nr:phosphatidylinositol glycan, class X, isoform CRA_d [Rattus norvegicus]
MRPFNKSEIWGKHRGPTDLPAPNQTLHPNRTLCGPVRVGFITGKKHNREFPILKCWAQSEVAAPCSLKSEEICQWKNMQYKSILKNLTVQVPVGLTIHTSLVCSVTLLITVLCSTLILLAVFKYGHFSL